MPAVKPKIVDGRIVNRWPGYISDEEYASIVARTERSILKAREKDQD